MLSRFEQRLGDEEDDDEEGAPNPFRGKVARQDNLILILVETGTSRGTGVVIDPGGNYYDGIGGHVKGYSYKATRVAFGLVTLGLVKEKDAEAFNRWFERSNTKRVKLNATEELHRTAQRLGYKLSKSRAA